MDEMTKRYGASVMVYITLSLATILSVALLSIFTSMWMTEQAEHDAQAINKSGSMRMLTYRIGLALQQGNEVVFYTAVEDMEKTWHNPSFNKLLKNDQSNVLSELFSNAHNNWQHNVKPVVIDKFTGADIPFPQQQLEDQIALVEQLVSSFQRNAEKKVTYLHTIQLIAMFAIVIIGSLIFHLLKNRIEKPLSKLTDAAHQIGKGNFTQNISIDGSDELALLAATLNQTCHSIATMYSELEDRVKDKTRELQRNNIALELLFDISHKTLERTYEPIDYQYVIDRLNAIIHGEKIELCLFNEGGDRPYQHVMSRGQADPCNKANCAECINATVKPTKYYLQGSCQQFGVLSISAKSGEELEPWQKQLAKSVVHQLAIGLSLNEQGERERRLTLMNERNVIARELHDSLAQSLSYLQIQVSRLQKNANNHRHDKQQAVIDELREGLSSAYQNLRDLLTTFRLKISEKGLQAAIEESIGQMCERTAMTINFDYRLLNIPLSPMEEIHLLQIAQEASQNAIKHSGGSHLDICIQQTFDNSVELMVEDDGVGLPDNPEKLNHYGLAIMQERSKHLAGELVIKRGGKGGTMVYFKFMPQVMHKRSA